MITGGTGFLGQALVRKLKDLKCHKLYIVSHKKFNLVNDVEVKKCIRNLNRISFFI